MPIYEYVCRCGEIIEMLRTIADRDAELVCPKGHKMERLYSAPSLAVWNPDRSFPNAVKSGDGKFPTRSAYEAHLKMNNIAESSTDGNKKSRVPRSMRS